MIKKLISKSKDAKQNLKTATRLFLLLWKFNKKIVAGSIIAVSIPAVIPFINAYLYKLIIDWVIANAGRTTDFSPLYPLFIARFGTLMVQYAAFAFQGYMEVLTWTHLPIHLYQMVLSKLASLDVEHFESSEFRDTLQKVKESYAYMPLNMYTNMLYLIQSLVQVTIAFFALATLSWVIALAIFLAALPSFFNQLYYSKTLWGVWSEHSPFRKKFWYLSELIQNKEGIKEMKIFATANKFLKEIESMQRKFSDQNIKVGRQRLRNSIGISFFGTAAYIGIESFAVVMTLLGRITIGSLSYYTFVIWNFETGIFGLFSNINRAFSNSLYVSEIFKVLDEPSRIKIPENGIKIPTDIPPKIEFVNVTFEYPNTNSPVLKDFSLVIEPGEKVAFVGENGAGKTTLIKLLARFYDVNKGEILINGHNIKDIDLPSWYKMLGVLFQDFIKYEYTLGENIHFGKIYEEYNLDKIKTAASLGGIASVAKKMDKGYDQLLGLTFEGGTELSLGQWQKVALSRAFFRNSPVLILDEPTASIDAKAEKEIFDKVDRLSQDKTVITISHRFSTVKNADKIYVIDGGKITESGNHKSLLKLGGEYAKLFHLQADRYK